MTAGASTQYRLSFPLAKYVYGIPFSKRLFIPFQLSVAPTQDNATNFFFYNKHLYQLNCWNQADLLGYSHYILRNLILDFAAMQVFLYFNFFSGLRPLLA